MTHTLSARGYTAFGSFFSDSVEDLISVPEDRWVPPARAVDVRDLWDAASPPPPFGAPFKGAFFYLDPSWTFLNHGAFGGACRPALRAAQRWAEHAEAQPLRFIDRELFPLMVHSVRAAARLVGAPPASIALCPHATYALHSVISSQPLREGDTLFCLDVGYGSVRKMLALAAERAGARVVVGAVPFPLTTPAALVAAVEAQVPPGCALAVFDHVASNSGLLLPAGALAAAAKRRGARAVLVDGAHGLGALDLDVPALGADFYVSNAHKWLCAPRGCGLLWAAPASPARAALRPAAISHGAGAGFSSDFIWDGARDYGPALALPGLLAWWAAAPGGLPGARAYCRATLAEGVALLAAAWGTQTHAPLGAWY
jgi:selenocysteine lyase/cysteine desulfurase